MNTKDLKQITDHYAEQQAEMRPKIAKLLGVDSSSDLSGLDLGLGTPGDNADIRPIGTKAKVVAPEKKKKRKLKSLAELPAVSDDAKSALK